MDPILQSDTHMKPAGLVMIRRIIMVSTGKRIQTSGTSQILAHLPIQAAREIPRQLVVAELQDFLGIIDPERAPMRVTRLEQPQLEALVQIVMQRLGNVNRQWALVDEQLQALRAKDGPYRRAFFRLIMELDQATFGDKFFTEMDVDSIRPPTEEEVLAKMELMAAERAAGGAGNDGAAAI
ncbi:hypothetical protein PtB15_14B343 [Puccinia triticina]|nr:hypothetical protein PtB15_14B343 [Puccinia triticina]